MKSIVKSLRVTDHLLAKCWEASNKIGLEPQKDTEALRIVLMAGLTAIHGGNWQNEPANPSILANIHEGTKQIKHQPPKVDALDMAGRLANLTNPTSGNAFLQINITPIIDTYFSGDSATYAHRIWDMMAQGHIEPSAQLRENPPICTIAAKLLYHTMWDDLSAEDQELCDKILSKETKE